MKFTIDQPALEKLLADVSHAVESKPMLPILANILFEAGDGILKATATSIQLTIFSQVECEVEGQGSTTVPVRELASLISTLDKRRPVTITLDDESTKINIRGGKSNLKLNGIPPADFPPAKQKIVGEVIRIPRKLLIEAIERTVYAADPQADEIQHQGVAFFFAGDRLRLYANDHVRMATCEIPLDAEPLAAGFEQEVIVPQRSLMEVNFVLNHSSSEFVGISISDPKRADISFTDDETLISSQVLPGKLYRDLAAMLPKSTSKITISKADLKIVLSRMRIYAPASNSYCKISAQTDSITITAHSRELGEAEDEIEGTLEGESFMVAMNIRVLIDALNSFSGSEHISLNAHKFGTSIAISMTSDSEPELAAVMSPMKAED